jgi:hypothetical protein
MAPVAKSAGALLLGVLLGLTAPSFVSGISFIGDLFMRLIRMLVVPVVLISIASGVAAMADPRRLGAVGARTLGLFALTTICAVSLGMAIGLVLHPGLGAKLGQLPPHALGPTPSLGEQLLAIVPTNILAALAQGDMLAIIFFSVLLGLATMTAGRQGRAMAHGLRSANAVLFQMVRLVMEVTLWRAGPNRQCGGQIRRGGLCQYGLAGGGRDAGRRGADAAGPRPIGDDFGPHEPHPLLPRHPRSAAGRLFHGFLGGNPARRAEGFA